MKVDPNNGFFISLDFELFWGWDDTSLSEAKVERLKNTRKVIVKILELFEKYNICATWATVGYLFAEDSKDLLSYYDNDFQVYDNENLNNFNKISSIKDTFNDCYFALDLLNKIKTQENQEIGSHTFSHFYALEKGVTYKNFEDDILKGQLIAKNKGFGQNKSLVFPRNQVAYIEQLQNLGIQYYRGNQVSYAYNGSDTKSSRNKFKRLVRFLDRYFNIYDHTYFLEEFNKDENGIYNIPASRFLAPFSVKTSFLEKQRIARIKNEMLEAAKKNKSYHLWWHPHNFGEYEYKNLTFLEEILKYFLFLNREYNFKSLKMCNSYDR